MVRLVSQIIFLLFLLLIPLKAQKKFQGEIKYHVKYEGENIQLNLFIQNKNFRMDKLNSGQNETYLFANGLSVVLYPELQIYAEYNDIKDDLLTTKPPLFDNVSGELKLIKTETKEKIHGIECGKWILKNQVTSVEMWVTREIEFNKNLIDALPEYFVDWKGVINKEKAFPLLIIIKDELGNTLYSFEASEIVFNAPPKETFSVPGSFKKQSGKK